MIHNDIQNQLALLVKTSAPPLIEIAQSPVEAPQWVPGQRLPAHVIASLPNGRFQVQVEDQILDMNLPRNSEPGQKVDLTFISASPRMTFALTPDLERALPPNSAVSLSKTAKFLGALLQRGGPNKGVAAALAQPAPVLQGTPVTVREFAARLRSTVTQSGLFYESHQAQWVSGERTLAALLQEPQARLEPLAPATGHGQPPVPDRQAMPQRLAELTNADATRPNLVAAKPSDATVEIARGSMPPQLSGKPVAMPDTPIHPQSQALVQQQLETLDSRQIVWQGQVWPGQHMDWEIEEDGSRGGQEEGDTPQWRTRLHLELPELGGVTARLSLDTAGVKVEFSADDNGTAALMRGEIGKLAHSIQASGLRVAGLMVLDDGGA